MALLRTDWRLRWARAIGSLMPRPVSLETRVFGVWYVLLLWAFCRLKIKPDISWADPGHGQAAEIVDKSRSESREKGIAVFMVGG